MSNAARRIERRIGSELGLRSAARWAAIFVGGRSRTAEKQQEKKRKKEEQEEQEKKRKKKMSGCNYNPRRKGPLTSLAEFPFPSTTTRLLA